ncbi:hypothetical protein D3C77_577820 [compost metagenome]
MISSVVAVGAEGVCVNVRPLDVLEAEVGSFSPSLAIVELHCWPCGNRKLEAREWPAGEGPTTIV